jgi:hypothetical protein
LVDEHGSSFVLQQTNGARHCGGHPLPARSLGDIRWVVFLFWIVVFV